MKIALIEIENAIGALNHIKATTPLPASSILKTNVLLAKLSKNLEPVRATVKELSEKAINMTEEEKEKFLISEINKIRFEEIELDIEILDPMVFGEKDLTPMPAVQNGLNVSISPIDFLQKFISE